MCKDDCASQGMLKPVRVIERVCVQVIVCVCVCVCVRERERERKSTRLTLGLSAKKIRVASSKRKHSLG